MNHSRYSGAYITTATWIYWEIRRYLLEAETPGRFGYFGKEDAK